MLIENVKKLSRMDQFLYWIRERHQIYLRKKAGKPKPWTDDIILQSIYFTNPYRENDKTTIWYKENIRKPLDNKPEIIFATVCFRWFNLISTGELLLRHNYFTNWYLPGVLSLLKVEREKGTTLFTGAFNISCAGSNKVKYQGVCEDYIHPFWLKRNELASFFIGEQQSLLNAHTKFSEFHGFGGSGFMAAQVVADLKYTYLLSKAPDWWTWSSIGPGSKKGLNWLLGREENSTFKEGEFLREINKVREIVNKKLSLMPLFHAQDIQNCFCEAFKYQRAMKGGKSRRYYNAKGGN